MNELEINYELTCNELRVNYESWINIHKNEFHVKMVFMTSMAKIVFFAQVSLVS
jgi:hypothetical protein